MKNKISKFARVLTLTALGMLLSAEAFAQNTGIAGRWKTIDDETGEPKSVVEIVKEGDVYRGYIRELLGTPPPSHLCTACPDAKKDKPLIGLEIFWDMKESKPNEELSGGKILDPKKGKTYGCRIRLIEKGAKLEVRGFVGMSLFGRSQTWLRAE